MDPERLATRLVNEQGRVDLRAGVELLTAIGPQVFCGPVETGVRAHALRAIHWLVSDEAVRAQVERMGDTVEERRAVVVALLTRLRQVLGSCFATAPARLVHEEQPLRFLKDLEELMATGRLSRVVNGIEYTVPFCPSGGDLLRRWEYTIASFSDVKSDFSKWNLYKKLGLEMGVEGGVGDVMAQVLIERIEQINGELEAIGGKYAIVHSAVLLAQGQLDTMEEEQRRWLVPEFDVKVQQLNELRDQMEVTQARGKKLTTLVKRLTEIYDKLFPDYFLEVYDPALKSREVGLTNDAPAGFRLLYKHGRANPRVWSSIKTGDQYIRFLCDFFIATEGALVAEADLREVEPDINAMVTAAVQHIRGFTFEGEASWAYISGGTMSTLVSAYYGHESLHHVSRVVTDPVDLGHFVVETLKEMPPSELSDSTRGILIQSPTHGFTLTPALFQAAWTDRGNTSEWLREAIVRPQHAALELMVLTQEMVDHFVELVASYLDKDGALTFRMNAKERRAERWSVFELRDHVVDLLNYGGPKDPRQLVDSLLYTHLPYHRADKVEARLEEIVGRPVVVEPLLRPITAHQLYELALAYTRSRGGDDLYQVVRTKMRELGYALAAPLIIGDPNWDHDYLGLLVNPGTGRLDLWRVDYLGIQGLPMNEWSFGEKPWVIYDRPHEYR